MADDAPLATTLQVRVTPEAARAAAAKYGERLGARMAEAVIRSGARLLRKAIPNTPRRAGFLRASLTPNGPYNISRLVVSSGGVRMSLGSNLPYAARQEFDESLSHTGTARWYPHKVGREGMKKGVFRGQTYQKTGGFGFLRKSLAETRPELIRLIRVALQGRGG